MRYTLVVLTRDRPESLMRCLTAVEALAPVDGGLEIIVVDDGSRESMEGQVLRRFAGMKVSFLRQANRGVSSARNVGICAAKGDFIGFIADDYILPRSFLTDVDVFFRLNPEAQVITHNLAPAGGGMLSMVQRLYMQLALGQELRPGDIRGNIASSFTLPASRAAVYRRSIFSRIGTFNEALLVGEDGEFARRLAAAGVPVNMFLWKFVRHVEATGLFDYLAQRIRYGRSYIRALRGGGDLPLFRRWGGLAIFLAVARKMSRWWGVAGLLRVRLRLAVLSPLIAAFLVTFYLGAYLEFRETPV